MDAKVKKSLINSIRKLSRTHNKVQLNHLKKLFIKKLVHIINKNTLNRLNCVHHIFIYPKTNKLPIEFHQKRLLKSIIIKNYNKKVLEKIFS
jgi:hypothetical protein